MSDSLGLSVGTTNLVAVTPGGEPTVRRAVLTLFPHRLSEVGIPSENPSLNERGLVISGFVERIGDPVPLVASDGSTYKGEQLVADALEALVRSARPGRTPEHMTAAVPAHWRPGVVDALRTALPCNPTLSPHGKPLPLVSDSAAALTALQAQPGLPARGVVALCDFGGTGTSITLADAGAGFRNVGPTVRFEDLSGDLIDLALLRHVLTGLDVDPSNTSAVVDLTRMREQCRIAKERLSLGIATGLTGPLPGPQSTVRVTRGELEALIRDPLDGLIGVVEETLQRNNIARTDLAALATVGGGARIPVVTQRLSEALRLPLTTTSQPQATAALGAALIARRGPEDRAVTGLLELPLAADIVPPSQASEPLAWSEDQSPDDIPPAAYADYGGNSTYRARPELQFDHGDYSAVGEIPPPPWYRRAGLVLAVGAAVVFAVALGVVGGVWWLMKPDDSSSQTMSINTTTAETEETPVASEATATASDTKLLNLVSSGYADDACKPVHPPVDNALATVDCEATSAWGGTTTITARYWLFADKGTLAEKFQEGVRETSELRRCPDSEDSPTSWHYNHTPDKVEGSVACDTDDNAPGILWTKDADLLLGYAYGPPTLEALHNWWLEFG